MLELTILADDMTGALDSAVHFAKRGYHTLCSLGQVGDSEAQGETEVLIYNSESRNLPVDQLEKRLQPYLLKMKAAGGNWFKKIDSTLRGSIGKEIELAVQVLEVDAVIFCPAFVESGRCVKEGELYLHGVRVDRTEIAREFPEDCCTANVLERLRHKSQLSCCQADGLSLEELLARLEQGPHVFSFDASTRDDIRRMIETGVRLEQAGKRVLWCGSAGFSKALAERMREVSVTTSRPPFSQKSTLYLVGSRKELSHNQAKELEKQGKAVCIRLPVQRLRETVETPVLTHLEWERITQGVRSGQDLVLQSLLEEIYPHCEDQLAKGLVQCVKSVLDGLPGEFSTIVSIGGDTTAELIRELKAFKLRLLGEIEEAVPFSELETHSGSWTLITKGGSVGDLDTLSRIHDWIKGEEHNENEEVGFSGLKVSNISLGTMSFGRWIDESASEEIIQLALEAGINMIDTADIYGRGQDNGDFAQLGEAEEIVGRAIKGRRQEVVLASKVCNRMGEAVNEAGLNRRHIMKSVEDSLKRLQTDYLDLYYAHRVDPDTPLEETLRAFDDLVRQGKVRYIACSNTPAWGIAKSHGISDRLNLERYVAVQPQYSLLVRDIERELLPFCQSEKVGVVVYSPLARGLLSGKYQAAVDFPENSRAKAGEERLLELMGQKQNFEKVKGLQQIARELELTLPQLALAWVLNQPTITSAVLGATKKEQLQSLLSVPEIVLSEEVLKKIDEVTR